MDSVRVDVGSDAVDPGSLFIERIIVVGSEGLDTAKEDSELLVRVALHNRAEIDLDNAILAIAMPEFGVKRRFGPFDLEENDARSYLVRLEVPAYVQPGEYDLRVSLYNEDLHRFKHRYVYVVG